MKQPQKIYRDKAGKWRRVNPPLKYATNSIHNGLVTNPEWLKFEQSITYHPFPDAPDTNEVVEAYLQDQWADLFDKEPIWREDKNPMSNQGELTRRVWILADKQEAKEEQPNLSKIAEKLKDVELFPESNQRAKDILSNVDKIVDFFKTIVEPSAPKVEVSAELEEASNAYKKTRLSTEVGAKYHFIHGANWQASQQGNDEQQTEIITLKSTLSDKEKEIERLKGDISFLLMLSDTWGHEWFKTEIWEHIQNMKTALNTKP